jgi:enamine deaminase RidA (YjgF/YER057c/UK114 family)
VDRPVTVSPHRNINPDTLPSPVGYSHATAAAEGPTVYLGGQTGHGADGSIDDDLVRQFDQACANMVEAVTAAGGQPEHLVRILIFATDVGEYRSRLSEIGAAYRRHLGKHYPAMALLGVTELLDGRAKVELVAVAVVPG